MDRPNRCPCTVHGEVHPFQECSDSPLPIPGHPEPEVPLEGASTPSLVVQEESDRIASIHDIGRKATERCAGENEKDARNEESEERRRIRAPRTYRSVDTCVLQTQDHGFPVHW